MTALAEAADPKAIVEQYHRAFYGGEDPSAGNTGSVRPYLADDLSFSGPGGAFSTADAYLRAADHARRAAKGVVTHAVVANGPDVCVFYDLLIDHPVGAVPIAEWYRLDGDKIAAIRSILDTAPLTAGAGTAGEQQGETAIDPVCHMRVPKAAAVATRDHRGTTYYFCSQGCAEAFDVEPQQYLDS